MTSRFRIFFPRWRQALAFSCAALLALSASAQIPDILNPNPRGLTEIPAASSPAAGQPSALPMSAQQTLSPGAVTPSGLSSTGVVPPMVSPRGGTALPSANAVPPGMAAQPPLPPDPSLSPTPVVFGSQIFSGRFAAEPLSSFNPDYQITIGDRVTIRMWGAFNYEASQMVDVQGNIFIPNVGPIAVRGVRNGDLHRLVEAQVKRTFKSNVGVYATLEAAQPVKVYVTGFVRAPGLYGGLSSDSVLHYLDMAGGIDPQRGSFLEVDVLRSGKLRAKIDLYAFLLDGRIEGVQFQDGDTVVVHPRKHAVQVSGDVFNPYVFELHDAKVSGRELLSLARPRPTATHMSIVRSVGAERRSEYHALADADKVMVQDGDVVTVTSDKYAGTILVRIDGAHLGARMLVLPQGARLKDALARVRPSPQAQLDAVQLFRLSVAARQKELLETSLRSLETYALTARSATSEEASLRSKESAQILEFINRARQVEPKGQVVLAQGTDAGETLLEDGDVLRVPEQSNLVLVNGEVLFPNALVYDRDASVDDYVSRAGGYNQGADRARVVVVHQNGSVADALSTTLRAGDEIMVLPKIETKSVELTRGITQIVYQIAVAAKVLFGL